jgi:diadenylate cyclase
MYSLHKLDWIHITWVDILDILVVAFVTYWILLLIKGTRAVNMLGGLAIIFIAFVASQILPMYTLHWILNIFLSSIIIIIVILFQEDLRRALTRMGRNPLFSGMSKKEESRLLEEITSAMAAMSERHVGALLVLERETRLDEFLEGGTELDAKVSRETLKSIFFPLSPLHDGATVLREGRIYLAGCFLPLTIRTDIRKSWGTRHRAALGIAERTDAVVILVSEEDGSISLAMDGTLQHDLGQELLLKSLRSIFSSHMPKEARKDEARP